MGALAYNLLLMLRQFYVKGEGVRHSVEWLIRRIIIIGAWVSCHARGGTFTWPQPSLWAHYYRAVFGYGDDAEL